jgi:hypothetical protein
VGGRDAVQLLAALAQGIEGWYTVLRQVTTESRLEDFVLLTARLRRNHFGRPQQLVININRGLPLHNLILPF